MLTKLATKTEIEYTTDLTGAIDWEKTLQNIPLNGFALYDCKSNPRLWNPDLGMLVFLPFSIPSVHFQFAAIDPFDELEVVASDLGTLLNHFAPVTPGGADEF